MNSLLKRSIPMGLASVLIYAIFGVLAAIGATGEGYGWLALVAPIGGFIAGVGCWWILVARRASPGNILPVVAGGLAGVVGHYLSWYLIIAGAGICYSLTGECVGSLGEAPMNPLEAFGGAALYSVISLLFSGWFTIPAGALSGFMISRAQRKSLLSETKEQNK